MTASLRVGNALFCWGQRTYVMGILNVTPDSFSGDGVYLDPRRAAERARELERAGADIIDVGGESTRPGHVPVPLEEELRRVLPALDAVLEAVRVPVSIDTRKAAVARAALARGARILNDVSGLEGDPEMPAVAARAEAVIVMAGASPMRSTAPDVVERVRADLVRSLCLARVAGVAAERIIIDPGFGFGKVWQENLVLLRRLGELRDLGLPMLVGLSRKSVIARVLGAEPPHRLEANAVLTALAIAGGADIVRVHDVREMAAAARLADAVLRGPPSEARA